MKILWLLLFFSPSVWAKPILTSKAIDQKEKAAAKSERCKTLIKSEHKLEVRSSRFYLPGKGYSYRVVISGFQDGDQALEIAKKLHPEIGEINLVQDNGHTLTYSNSREKFIAVEKETEPPKTQEEKEIVVRILPSAEEERKPTEDGKKTPTKEVHAVDILQKAGDVLHKSTKKWENLKSEKFHFSRTLFPSSSNNMIKADHIFLRDEISMIFIVFAIGISQVDI